jgi:hypothetical protein
MIISTLISNRRKSLIRFAVLLFIGVSIVWAASPAIAIGTVNDVRASLQASFEKAVLGKASGTLPTTRKAKSRSFAMVCTSRLSAARPMLSIILPQSPAARRHVFAVVSPSGRLYELYSPYSDDVEIADIIIPSDQISWQKARTRARFALSASQLRATELGQQTPTPIFTEKGRYKFALVSSIQKDLIAVSDTPNRVTVYAGCLIDWMP